MAVSAVWRLVFLLATLRAKNLGARQRTQAVPRFVETHFAPFLKFKSKLLFGIKTIFGCRPRREAVLKPDQSMVGGVVGAFCCFAMSM